MTQPILARPERVSSTQPARGLASVIAIGAASVAGLSLLGTLAWTSSFTLIGYAFSNSFGAAAGALTHGALAAAVLAALALGLRELRRARRVRATTYPANLTCR